MSPEGVVKIFQVAVQNYRQQFSDDEAAAIQTIWYDAFRMWSDDLMETAMRLVLHNSLFFPNVADLQKAIDELLAEERHEQDKPRQLERGQSREEAKATLSRMQKYIAAFRDNNYDQAAWIAEMRPFAKALFTEISDESIDRNYNELSYARQRNEICHSCIWTPKDCDLRGYRPALRMQADGFIQLTMVPCGKHDKGRNY